jgi:hypothetical protein
MKSKLSYVLNTFKMQYQLEELPEICYKSGGRCLLLIKSCRLNDLNNDYKIDPKKIIWKDWKGRSIPFLFDVNDGPIISEEGKVISINFDIMTAAFYLLSGYQELDNAVKDKYGRFPFTESIQHKLNIIHIPVVNYYFDILKTAIEKAYQIELKPKTWGNYNFATCITHDIDTCESAWLQGSYRELKKGNFKAPFRLLNKKLFYEDDWFNFEKIIAIEKKYDACSSFYFLPVRGKKGGIKNADYSLFKTKFKTVFSQISDSGSEVGVHGSVGSHKDFGSFSDDLRKIGKEVCGGRFHFLLYDVHTSPGVLEKSGIRYDSSLGFAEQYGFRNSYCLPFYIYDLKSDKPTKVLEIPLVLMDCTLSSYIGMDKKVALEKVIEVIDEVEKFQGCFTILWHNTFFSDYKYKGWREVFEEIIAYCQHKNALLTSGEKIVRNFAPSN